MKVWREAEAPSLKCYVVKIGIAAEIFIEYER